jgi:DNA adenine methylase
MQSPIRAKLLLWKLRYTPFARVEYVLSRKKTRNKIVQAQRTITRTFMAFGGTGAYNNTTGFKAKSLYEHRSVGAQWIDLSWQLEVFIERLQGVIIENRPALKVIAQQDHEKTLFYVDPPYVKSTRYHENIYDHEMTDEQHIELAKALHNIEGMVVLSGYHSNLYDELYKDWKTKEKEAIIASPSGNNRRTEVLWFNPACSRNKYPLFKQGE